MHYLDSEHPSCSTSDGTANPKLPAILELLPSWVQPARTADKIYKYLGGEAAGYDTERSAGTPHSIQIMVACTETPGS